VRARVLLAVVACGWACGSPDRAPRWRETGATTPREGGTLRFASKDAISSLDPAIAYDEVSLYALHAIVEGLVGYAVDSTALEPRLAERWQISDDGLVYRFWLRPGLRYSDGRPIAAADFERGLERALQRKDSPYGAQLGGVVGAQDVLDGKTRDCTGITATGERELEIRIAAPNAALLYVLAMPFASPVHADHLAAAGAELRRTPLASGPYELAEWDEGRRLVLRRRAHYHDPSRQRIEQIVQLENVPRDVQFLMFERGELEVAERLAAPDHLWIKQQAAWAPYVRSRPLMNAYGSRMNTRVKPFDDRRVRQAMNYALDQRHVVKLLNGTAEPSHGALPPGAFGRDDALAPYPHDPAKARALLREAGYPEGFTVQYLTLADEEAEKLAVSLQADLAEIGVRIEISLVTFSTYASTIGNADGPAFSIGTWAGDFPDPTSLLDPLFHSRGIAAENATNSSFYANPELDKLLDEARAERVPEARAALYRRAERILHDDAPWIWGYHQMMTEVVQPYVRTHGPHPVWVRDYTTAWLDFGPDGKPVPR
jgi:ABC-type transport system substrate-binding protein